MAVYCMSDIHGHLKEFQECLGRVQFRPGKDELYLLGDYIDWGPDSMDVVQFVMFLQERFPQRVHCLMGNHEEMMLEAILENRRDVADVWLYSNRGADTLLQYRALPERTRREVFAFLRKLPYGTEATVAGRRYLMAHAFPYFADPTKDQRLIRHIALWKRLRYQDNPFVEMLEYYPERRGLVFERFLFGHTITSNYFLRQMVDEWRSQGMRPEVSEADYPSFRETLGENRIYENEYMVNLDCGGKCIGLLRDNDVRLREEAKYSRLAILRLDDGAVFYSGIAKGV